MSMKDPADMTDDELEAAESAVTGAAPDPDADTTTEETTETTEQTDSTATEGAETDSTTTTATTSSETATTETPETQAAAQASAGAEAGKVAGVASKDGTLVLPYSALQAERRSARHNAARAERAERESERLKQEIEDLRAGKSKESTELTEEEVQRMEADYPEDGKKWRAAFERTKELERQVAAAAPKEPIEDEISDDPTQEAIDQVPLLVEWQHDPKAAPLWERAIAVDNLLKDSPKWKDKPATERFERVAEMVAEEFDIEVPGKKAGTEQASSTKQPAKPTTDAKRAVESAPRTPPSTLSDLKGGAVPDHGQLDLKNMSPRSMLAKFQDMSDEEMDRALAKLD